MQETQFVTKCRAAGMATHPLWIGVYERIEQALQEGEKTTKDLERYARLYPLGPTLREMQKAGLIRQTEAFAGVEPFYNPTWKLFRGARLGKP